jgi:hypothetical protein
MPTPNASLLRTPLMAIRLPLAIIGLVAVIALLGQSTSAEVVDLPVPYHSQYETWYCAEASLQMVFDYWGEEIPQHDIGDVANERPVGGTYASDLMRAVHFSNLSTSYQYREGGGSKLVGYDQRSYGYMAYADQWSDSNIRATRYTDLMGLVRGGYPVILLSWLDTDHDVSHFRVVKGFDTDTGDFLVNDPVHGPNYRMNMTLLVDDLWTSYDRWGMVVVPWNVEVQVPDVVGPGEEFTVKAIIEYPLPEQVSQAEQVYSWPDGPIATITVPPPFALAPGENATLDLNITRGGDFDTLEWTLVSPVSEGFWTADVVVLAEAKTMGYSTSYIWYTDRTGGVGSATVGCDAVPPTIDTFDVAGGSRMVGDPSIGVVYGTSDAHTGVDRVRLSIDGGLSWSDLVGTGGDIEITLDLGDGDYQLMLDVTDSVGNQASTTTSTITLDTTPPRILLFTLAGGSPIVTHHRILVELVAEDDMTVLEMMTLRVGTEPWGAWEPFREQFELVLPADGETSVEVRLRDSVDNTVSAVQRLTVDSSPPSITYFEVAGGLGTTRELTVEVTFSARDELDKELDYTLAETPTGTSGSEVIASDSTVLLDWTYGGEGSLTLTLTVTDWAHHSAEASVTVIVDTEPPLVDLVLNGGERVTTTPDIPIAVSAIDVTTDVAKARIKVSSNEWGPWSDMSSFRRVDLGPGEGERTVHIQVLDGAGNIGETSATVFLDTSVPTASVTFTLMKPGGVVDGGSAIVLTFSEEMDEGSVRVVLMDNSSGLIDCDLSWNEAGRELLVAPQGTLPRGSHFVLQVQGKDLVGNDLEFGGVIFSTPDAEDDWDMALPEDSTVLVLILVLVLAAVVALGYGLVKRRG